MPWTPRTTAPDVTIKYYRGVGYYVGVTDGVNECLVIDTNTGFVMPNCVGYSWGRWYEAFNVRPDLSRGDAYLWYAAAAGYYQRGNTPQVGAIACWYNVNHPNSGGHVAVVESITGGIPTTSNSGYGGPLFWTEQLSYDTNTGDWLRGYYPSDYGWQGFIYPPSSGGGGFKLLPFTAGQRRFSNGRGRIINNRRF